ncbi:DUF833 domain protein [Viridothelium virens]|uniref:DUF833 domain protein n=1 Tax=Viridothelium virens TaxID=1048519 RepID=A0A6A6H340_VIRVR|nr:DUF833 domain protein [Viridothelium virens]
MCIAFITTAHPHYPLILISNRDEYLSRATAPADWWSPPYSYVLGGHDLEREEKGTWLGITKQGRVAVLTNFKEDGDLPKASKSRGGIIKEFLATSPHSSETTAESAKRLVEGYRDEDVGGFSLVLGQLNPSKAKGDDYAGLAIISNRTPDLTRAKWIATGPDMTHGLSNSHYGDRTWPKVNQGEDLLDKVIKTHARKGGSEDHLITKLFEVLSVDSLPKKNNNETWEAYLFQLRKSIFIPAFGPEISSQKPADELAAAKDNEKIIAANSNAYGTQKQTVILVDWQGRVVFVERSLYDQKGRSRAQDRKYEFQIETPS